MKKIASIFLLSLCANVAFATTCPTEAVINSNLKEIPNGLLYFSVPEDDTVWIGAGQSSFDLRGSDKILSFKRAKLTNNKTMAQCEYIASVDNGQYTKEVTVFFTKVANFTGTTSKWVANGEVCEQNSVIECSFAKQK